MNNSKILLGMMAVTALVVGCEKKPKLDTDMGKASYAIGQQIGQNLKNQNIEFDADTLAVSVKEAATGKEPRMKPEEMQAALMKLQEGLNKKQMEAAEKNGAEGKAWLDKNKGQAGIQTTPSGLQYQIVSEGKGKKPSEKDTVKVHYTGTLISGQKFDSSVDRGQPAEFPVNAVIKGWSEALQLMKVGTKAKLFIPPELGYGPTPRPGIPANSVLVFDVELLDVVPQSAKK